MVSANGEDWRAVHRISLGGTGFLALDRYLRDNPQITTVISCLDNDPTGNRRSDKMLAEYTDKGYTVRREAPRLKDYNEDLLAMKHRAVVRGEYERQSEAAAGRVTAVLEADDEDEDEWERE
jgi:hypothetical protein